MRAGTLGLLIIGTLAAGSGAWAQTAPAAPPSSMAPAIPSVAIPPVQNTMPRAAAPATVTPLVTTTPSIIVEAATLEAGANSFTESQAKGRFEAAGFSGVQGLSKDEAGFWRARGTRNGMATDLAMDFHGHIAAGAGVATLRSGAMGPAGSPGTTPPPR